MRRVAFSLVPDPISHDTIECLKELLARAKSGEVIGIAYVAMLRRRQYFADAAGECHRNPTHARGMVRALDDELGLRVRGGGGHS
jgi:hypothetical protein